MAEPQPVTVLNVNDDEPTLYAMSRVLRRAGFAVAEARTGAEALARAAGRPDLLVLDVQLPDLDGFEVCRRLRADPATAHVPVVYLSAHFVESADRSRGLETGADAYLIHPVEPRELIATVQALLRIRRAEAEARALARRWQVTFDALRDAIAVLGPDGRVACVNQAMARFLGTTPAEAAGRPYGELLGAEAGVFLGFEGVQGRQVREQSVAGRWLRVTTDPIRDEGGTVTGFVQTVADLSEPKRAEEAERAVRAQAAQIELLRGEIGRLEQLSRGFGTGPGV